MKTRQILKTLSNMYDGLFYTEPCVKLAYSKLETYLEPCQISIMDNCIQNHVYNPGIFRIQGIFMIM